MPRLRDLDSGELHYVGVMKRRRHKEPFTMIFCEELARLIADQSAQLSQLQWKLFMYLLAIVEYENVVEASVVELAQAVECDRSSASRALRALEALALIHREPARGTRPRRILLDPHLVFRGVEPQRARMLAAGWPPVALAGAPNDHLGPS
jgi:hypothetical protein